MFPIIFLSFFAVAFSLERLVYWFVTWQNSLDRKKKLRKIFNPPFNYKNALEICQKSQDVVIVVLHNFLKLYNDHSLVIAERKTRMIAEEKSDESRKFLDILSLIANISGTLGLMGTVVGISLSFKTLAAEDSRGLALSLSTAMYTTIGGIILFLTSYLFLFFFQKYSDKLDNALDINIQKLNDILEVEEKSKIVFDTPKKEKERPKEQTKTKVKSDVSENKKSANTSQSGRIPIDFTEEPVVSASKKIS